MTPNLKEFAKKHYINILNENKRAHKHTGMNTNFFRHSGDYNILQQEYLTYETENLYTVEISETELNRIADFEAEVFNNLKEHGHYGLFETLMQQKERERYLRDKYPAMKKAYEHYSLILKLAESGEL
jgi:hypothetical protein